MTPGAALITGAAKRLGRAMALELAGRGWSVAIHYNTSRGEAEQTSADALEAGAPAAPLLQADLTVEDQTRALVPRAVETLGAPLTLLVNNASLFVFDTVSNATRESWDRNIESNLRAPFVLSQFFAGQCPRASELNGEPVASGLIVNMLDQRVRRLTPNYMSYTVAKMGLWGLTRTLAQALAPRIRVNAIGPGPTLPSGAQSEEQFRTQRAAIPLERSGDPEDICAALRFLVASKAVTGQMIAVDGGQHLAWRTPDVLAATSAPQDE